MEKLTDDELILGITKKEKKQAISNNIFSSDFNFRVAYKGKDNESIVSGETIKNLLPLSAKNELLNGKTELEYKSIIIELIQEKKEVIKEEIKEIVKKEVKKAVKKKVAKK